MDFQTLLDQAMKAEQAPVSLSPEDLLAPATTQVSNKQAEVLKASVEKQAALGGKPAINHYQIATGIGNQSGAGSMSEIETDLRTLSPAQLNAKYGAEAQNLILRQAAANRQLAIDQAMPRSGSEAIYDTVTGIESALAGGLGGIASWGVGLIDEEAGATMAERIQKGMEWVQSTQSDALNASRRAKQARDSLDYRDNTLQREQEIAAGKPELVADLSRFGRDVVDAIKNADDPTILGQGTAEGVGSLLGGVPIAKGIRALGTAVSGGSDAAKAAAVAAEIDAAAGVASGIGVRATNAANKTIDFAAWPAATALLEGGGAYTGTASEVMGMSFEQLEKSSELYRDIKETLIEAGLDEAAAQEEARAFVANESGQDAAAIQAPIGGVTGLLTRYAETPFRVPNANAGVRNALIKEPTEEFIQSGSGQVAQNVGISENADDQRTLSEGVGQAATEGAIYGVGTGAAVQGPGIAAQRTIEAGKDVYQGTRKLISAAVKAGKPLFNAIVELGDKRLREKEKASPIADEVVQQAAEQAIATADTTVQTVTDIVNSSDMAPEQKEEANNYVSSLVQAMQYDVDTDQNIQALPEAVRNVVAGTKNRIEAIQKMAREVARLPEGQEQLNAAVALYDLMTPIEALKEADPEAMDAIPDGEVRKSLLRYEKLVADIDNTPSVQRAFRTMETLMKNAAVQKMTPVSEAELNTPEGTKKVNTAIAVANLAPDQGNLEVVQGILKHAEEGRLDLTTDQRNALNASIALLKARKTLEQAISERGLQSAKDVVSSQIVAGNDPLRKHALSALQHTKGIVSAMKGNNTQVAQARLQDFGLFVQHMKNKVEALNKHFTAGNPKAPGIAYQALMPVSRTWKSSANNPQALHKNLFVNTASAKSIDQAQSIGIEQQILADVYNGLVKAFPELGLQQIEPLQLDSRLIGKPDEVVEEFKNGKRSALSKVAEPVQPTKVVEQVAPVEETPVQEKVEPVVSTKQEEKPVPETEPVLEEELSETEVSEKEPVPVVEPKEPVTGIKAIYPKLVDHVKNMFLSTFSLPTGEQAPSRILGEESPVALVSKALTSSYQLEAITGKESKYDLTDELSKAYRSLLSVDSKAKQLWDKSEKTKLSSDEKTRLQNVGGILTVMQENLNSFLNEKYNKKDPSSKTIGELFASGSEVNRTLRGKALNIVEATDGGYVYNQPLSEAAAIAGMQWLITAGNYETVMDEEDVAAITGVAAEELPGHIIDSISKGMSLTQAKLGIAKKIRSYWGVQSSVDKDMAYADGIPEAVAAEVLRAMIDLGLVQVTKIQLDESHGLSSPKTIDRYETKDLDEVLQAYPSAIDEVILLEPEEVSYLDGEVPPVATRQMNNPDVENTVEQRAALKNEQQTPHYLDMPMTNFYVALGENGILDLFGEGKTEGKVFNVNHLKTVEGQNRTLVTAYKQFVSKLSEIENRSGVKGVSPDTMEIRYAYNMSRVGRMQMLGRHNPQASKLVREAILPTWSTLDLSGNNQDHFTAFHLSLGQALDKALDEKLHKQTPEETVAQIRNALSGSLAPAVELLEKWIDNSDISTSPNVTLPADFPVAEFKKAMSDAGVAVTPAAVHALLDYTRFKNTSDKSKFRTSLYLEADGVTNGPINAMMLMSIGKFTPTFIQNVEKGGISFGTNKPMHTLDKVDLYQTSTENTFNHLTTAIRKMRGQDNSEAVLHNMNQLLTLMSLTLPDVSIDPDKSFEDGALVLKRGIAKNPLTITIYGSSKMGIAGKLTSMVMDSIYEKMSMAGQRMEENKGLSFAQALFFGEENAEAKFNEFMGTLNTLTETMLSVDKEGKYYLRPTKQPTTRKVNPATFTFSKDEIKALRQNMLVGFVNPMSKGIEDTVGSSLIKAVTQVRVATQVQSIVLEGMYKKAIDQKIKDRSENDDSFKAGDFLSEKDVREIKTSLKKFSPLIETGSQNFLVTKSEALNQEKHSYSRALNGTMRTSPDMYVPANAGVAGIPFLTIGMGDGVMMQKLALDKNVKGTLKIFDGMHMPLDQIKTYSTKANKAVFDSYKGNPLEEVNKVFSQFVEQRDAVKTLLEEQYNYALAEAQKNNRGVSFTKDAPVIAALTKALSDYVDEGAEPAAIMSAIESVAKNVSWAAKSIEARHKALQDMAVSIDQMAAAASPYSNSTTDVAPSNQEIVQQLNARYEYHLNKPTEQPAIKELQVNQNTVDEKVSSIGKAHSSGVRILSWTSLKEYARQSGMTDAQKVIYDQIIRSMGTKEYKIILGTPEQMSEYQKQKGLTGLHQDQLAGTHGYVSIPEKTIYLLNPSSETLVHELIHAASYEIILAHYNGQSTSPEVVEAIERLEAMKNTFMTSEINNQIPIEIRQAVMDARAAIQNAEDNLDADLAVSKASALNEFMAWALTNEQITKSLKDTRAPKLVQLAKDAIKAIKQMIWGKKRAPQVDADFLSNLQFNASVLIRTQPKLTSLVQKGILFHASQPNRNLRLEDLRNALTKKIVDYIPTTLPKGVSPKADDVSDALALSSELVTDARAVFNMDHNEAVTFSMYVAALATQAKIDSNVLARAQELYAHVTKVLKVEDLMNSDASDIEAERYYATQKYNMILGKTGRKIDKFGRTTMLPVFIGLATINEEFRNVLSKIEKPKSSKNEEGTLDARLENIGNTLIDKLHDHLSGDKKSTNVRQAIDNLNTRLYEISFDEQSLISEVTSKAGGLIDSYNDRIVGSMVSLADKSFALGEKLSQGNVVQKNVGRILTGLSAIASEQIGQKVAEDVVSMMNQMDVPKPLYDLINDLVGRTQSNAPVYDMIKQVRAMVQQLRQQFRDYVPHIMANKFSRAVTASEWSSMFRGMAKTDLAVLLDNKPVTDVLNLLVDQTALDNEINDIEELIRTVDPQNWNRYQEKMKQLARFMNTGVPGKNLLRNAHAIAHLFGEAKTKNWKAPKKDTINLMDKLITLYAVDTLQQSDKDTIVSLVQSESAGMEFVLNYLNGQRKGELNKVRGGSVLSNHYKGYIPSTPEQGVSLKVADDTEFTSLATQGYSRIGAYNGSEFDNVKRSRGYYFAPLSGKTAFSQGIMQNVKHTASGVDETYGFTTDMIAGRITDPALVKAISKRISTESVTVENLLPVYDGAGNVFAYERSLDPKMVAKLNGSTHLGQMVGVWRGRQVEEKMAQTINERLIDKLHDVWEADIKQNPGKQKEYVNLMDYSKLDAVQRDAVSLFSERTLNYIKDTYGEGEFWVRKDMLEDVTGYRNASVGDFFSGNSRWSDETQENMKKLLVGLFGVNAYRWLIKSEQFLQNVFADVRSIIVVKSVIVPMANFMSNMYQLASRGVPLGSIVKGMPSKLSEIQSYTKTRLRQIEVEAELRAVGDDHVKERKLLAEIRSITDSHKRMSIWPLIEAGEFSSIADVGMTSEDLELSSGNFTQWIERQIDKLPDGLKTMARYGYVSRDTALFQGLQKAVQYGDFMAKAVLYDDLTQRKKLTKEQALARITEEFVNYDRLPGRDRGYLENMGMLWFYNYKIRISKIALSTLRNNPLHALIAVSVPMPDGVGLTVADNLFSKAVDGSLSYSVGPGMVFQGPGLNPWYNLVD